MGQGPDELLDPEEVNEGLRDPVRLLGLLLIFPLLVGLLHLGRRAPGGLVVVLIEELSRTLLSCSLFCLGLVGGRHLTLVLCSCSLALPKISFFLVCV
jgi:hypothetical protein